MLRVILDTDVMVAGFVSDAGASRRLLFAALDGEIVLLQSTSLLLEYEAVLTRPKVLGMAGLEAVDVGSVLDELASVCVPASIDYRWRPEADDPDDDLVLEAAVNGSADVIVTFNVADMTAGARRFGIEVERPGITLRRIRKS